MYTVYHLLEGRGFLCFVFGLCLLAGSKTKHTKLLLQADERRCRFGHCSGYRSPSHTLSPQIGKEFEGLFWSTRHDISKTTAIRWYLSHFFNPQLISRRPYSASDLSQLPTLMHKVRPQLNTYNRSKKEQAPGTWETHPSAAKWTGNREEGRKKESN